MQFASSSRTQRAGASARPLPAVTSSSSRRAVTARAARGPSAGRSGAPAAPGAAVSAPAAEASLESLPLAPGEPASIPLLDDTPKLLESPFKYGLEAWRRHGADVFRTPVLLQDSIYMVVTAKAITELLADDGYSVAFNNSEAFKRLMNDEVSNSTMADGSKRMQQRRLLSPAFSPEALNAYVPIMVEQVESYLAGLVSSEGRAFDLRSEVRTMTVDLANNLLVGLTGLDAPTKRLLQDLLDDFFAGTQAQIASPLPGSSFQKGMAARRRLDELLMPRLVAQREELLAAGKIGSAAKPRKSVLAYMMEARIQMGDEDALDDLNALTHQCIGILLAGVDTSGSGFTNTLCVLSQLPEVVAKLREEQDRVAAAHGPQITRAALDASPYLDAVVREVQYISPSGALNFRHALKDLDIQGHLVPKGALLLLNWHTAHMIEDAEHRGRPEVPVFTRAAAPVLDQDYLREVFCPERWLPGGLNGARPTMLSFHHGPFTCLGMTLYNLEAKSLVAALVRSYDLEVTSDPAYVRWLNLPVSVPDKRFPMWARLKPRAA